MNFDPKNLTEEQRQEFLLDENNNDIPDVLEEGKLPSFIRHPQSASEAKLTQKAVSILRKFIRVSDIKKHTTENTSYKQVNHSKRAVFNKWIFLFVIIVFIILRYIFGIKIF